MQTKVVAISGASGSGKTSVVRALAEQTNAPSVFFEDYTTASSYPDDMNQWFLSGANVSEIKTPQMLTALRCLISNQPPLILVEEPFGKERESIGSLIDIVILLDTPLSLCLSRVLQRNQQKLGSVSSKHAEAYLKKYNEYLKAIYAETVAQVRSNCDLCISNSGSLSDTVSSISKWLVVNN